MLVFKCSLLAAISIKQMCITFLLFEKFYLR